MSALWLAYKHSRSCRYHNHPDFNPDRNVACMASPAALKHTPAHIALDMDLKAENPNKQGQGQPHQGGREVIIPNSIREVEVKIPHLKDARATTGTKRVTTTPIRGIITTTLHQGTRSRAYEPQLLT